MIFCSKKDALNPPMWGLAGNFRCEFVRCHFFFRFPLKYLSQSLFILTSFAIGKDLLFGPGTMSQVGDLLPRYEHTKRASALPPREVGSAETAASVVSDVPLGTFLPDPADRMDRMG